ncbi:coronafacic acid synthetase [Azorhizophilus paspali]|uniref:Coronafacic acid synthetase n=1 Tax=Azorhizophilus paspali TaxID=69963 RepID=A0ABV6SFC0_AZOPA
MTDLDWTAYHLVALGQAESRAALGSATGAAQKTSAYADPLSWLVFEAVERALDSCRDAVLTACQTVGHIVVSDICTLHTMQHIARDLGRNRLSPLRFSGACPGLVCSLPGQLLRFSGPSLVLSMPPQDGLAPAALLAQDWLENGAASHVLVSAHDTDGTQHRVRCTLLQPQAEQVSP